MARPKCPACRTKNPLGARFCAQCGARLSHTCPQCKTQNPANASFCTACGVHLESVQLEEAPSPWQSGASDAVDAAIRRLVPHDLAAKLRAAKGQLAGERRIVSILFCDVRGSTAMAEGVDPEDVLEILDGAFEWMIEPILRYEGTVARLMGDGILAFFGAPVSHEDDAERACRAALDILSGMQTYGEKLESERGLEAFSVRVGVNTGLVAVGEVGSDLRVEYTAMGDAVNLAARMESSAAPGTILITENTRRKVASLFVTERVGDLSVKGRAGRVPCYRLLGPRMTTETHGRVADLDSPIVGRESEFEILRKATRRLREGVGGIVTIVGEAGIGKSRLVAELRRATAPDGDSSGPEETSPASARSLRWVEGRCLSYASSVAYQLWLSALQGWLAVEAETAPGREREIRHDRVRQVCGPSWNEVCPYLKRLLSIPLTEEEDVRLTDLGAAQLKAATFRALDILVHEAAEQCPLVLVCEDLHWADPTSIELLERLLALTDRVPLLLICAFRPDADHGSWRVREVAARRYRHRHTDLWLRRLTDSESETMVGNLLGAKAVSPNLRDSIVRRAEGNPFYVEEIIRALIDDEAIEEDTITGRWEPAQDLDGLALPDTLRGVLVARIDRLGENEKRILQIASVVGRIFPLRVLAAVAEAGAFEGGARELHGHLVALQRQEMIRERARLPEVEYIFKHELTREAAYAGLLKKERRGLHRKVAETLERLFPDRAEEHVGLLAHHWERAGDPRRAVKVLLKAGDQARMVYAHAEATDYYQRALIILKEQGAEDEVARTLMKLGLVHTAAFQPTRARQAYREGFGLWRPEGSVDDVSGSRTPACVMRFALATPPTLDPGMAGDDVSQFVTGQLFEGLVEVDEESNVLPAAASSWETRDGGTRYLFHLRDDLRWSDGTQVTALDFEHTWKRNLNPATGSPLAHLLYVIKNARAVGEGSVQGLDCLGVTALDDQVLEVSLEGPIAYLLHLVAHPVTYPLPPAALEARRPLWENPESVVSNGPYTLLSWQPGESILLGRNPFYGGRFPGNATTVECTLFTDFGPVLEAYAEDTLDAISMITSDSGTVALARRAHEQDLLFTPQLSTSYLVFRVDRPPFDDVRVRRAFAHTVDREGLSRDAWHGQYVPANGGFVPPGMPGHSSGIGLPYEPARARRLLAEAGYPEGQGFPEITWLYSAGASGDPMLRSLRESWDRDLGVALHPRNVSWTRFMERGAQDPAHLSLWGWFPDCPDPDNMLRVTFHSQEGFNAPRWQSPRYDALVEKAARITEQRNRMKLYREADHILVAEKVVVVPLGYGRGRILVKPWVKVPRMRPALMRLKEVVCNPVGPGAGDE